MKPDIPLQVVRIWLAVVSTPTELTEAGIGPVKQND